jgi:hypothetical protein
MSKKSDEKDKDSDKKDLEEEDESTEEEEEDEEEDEDEDEEEEEDEVEAAPAKPAGRPARRGSVRHEEKSEVEAPQQEDPYWWTPHAVLGALVLIGVLGFLGVFNNTPLRRLAAPVGPPAEEKHETAAATPTPPATPPARPRPGPSGQQAREMFGAKHLLVMYKGGRRAPPNVERSKEEAKVRAEEARKKAKADPAKFADLVKEYSDEPGAGARGGDLGKFPKGAMVPEFQAGLDKIKVNEISEVVETPFGFHVILRTQ